MADGSKLMRDAMTRNFVMHVPHNHALALEPLEIGKAVARFKLPWAPHLVGNPDTGVLHGGAITAMLDACCGAAVFAALSELKPIATLDLRIDYLKAAEPGRSVFGRARCYKLTRNVAFTRAVAYQDGIDDVVAHAVGTFMLSTKQGKA